MRNTNKKGFTIVELVVVVAVIAILAAVLIPTFSGVIRKANIASDTAVAKNLNEAAIIADADTFEEAIAAVREAGYYLANLNAKADQCYFVWEDDSNQFVLYDLKNSKVLYSNTKVDDTPDASWCFAVSNSTVAAAVKAKLENVTIKNTAASIADVNNIISAGGDTIIYVDESVIINESNVIVVNNASANVVIDLGSASVAGNNASTPKVENVPFNVTEGTLTIKGGTIQATGEWYDADGDLVSSAVVADSGVFNVDSTTFDCPGGEILLSYGGANGTVSNAVINTKSSAINVGGNSNVVVENCTINVDNEAVWVSATGGYTESKATIKSGSYNGIGNTIAMYGGTIVIEGGEFTSVNKNLFKFYNTGSTLIIKGGTFNGVKFEDLTADVIKGMFSTGTSNYAGLTVTTNNDGSITVSN